MNLKGSIFVGGEERAGDGAAFFAREAATGQQLGPRFQEPSDQQISEACQRADEATCAYAETSPEARSRFLVGIADGLESLGADLLGRCMLETGLPRTRLENELHRTTYQLRMFADIARSGRYRELDSEPSGGAEHAPPLILKRVTLGPVAVFGASNFPLAFSVAGGDTASALAAGCPVVVKGHPGHPGVSEIVGRVIAKAADLCRMPAGVFSLLTGPSEHLGAALVTDPHIGAVAFTGSRRGGLALQRLAQRRPAPIPVFAEMGSVNPVTILPGALRENAIGLAQRFVSAMTLGAGQFCTNPGIVFAISGDDLDRFSHAASEAVSMSPSQVMLTPDIAQNYRSGVEGLALNPAVSQLARGCAGTPFQCQAGLFQVGLRDFLASPSLHEEVFGALSLLVTCDNADDLQNGLLALEGQLAASIFFGKGEEEQLRRILYILERKAGRVIVNDFATGVEVNRVMIHGGPFPATTDSRSTSVGALAIERFLRPVCIQGLKPSFSLPVNDER